MQPFGIDVWHSRESQRELVGRVVLNGLLRRGACKRKVQGFFSAAPGCDVVDDFEPECTSCIDA